MAVRSVARFDCDRRAVVRRIGDSTKQGEKVMDSEKIKKLIIRLRQSADLCERRNANIEYVPLFTEAADELEHLVGILACDTQRHSTCEEVDFGSC